MTTTRPAALRTAALMCTVSILPTLCAADPAEATADISQDAYKCVVLGMNDKCPREADSPSYRIEVFRELGPRATGMVKEGMQVDTAVARARQMGETPKLRIVRIIPREGSITQREMREQADPRLAGHEQTLAVVDEP